MKMTTESEALRINAIRDRLSILFGLEINPIISDILDDLVIDVEWLSERLIQAWATIGAYQEEIKLLYEGK